MVPADRYSTDFRPGMNAAHGGHDGAFTSGHHVSASGAGAANAGSQTVVDVSTSALSVRTPDLMRVIELLIRSSLEKDGRFLMLAEVADRLCTSPRTLKRRIRANGMTFRQLLTEMRMTRAVSLLAQSRFTIEALAENIGYSSGANFTRAFKRWAGTTPRGFKNHLSTGQPLQQAERATRERTDPQAA